MLIPLLLLGLLFRGEQNRTGKTNVNPVQGIYNTALNPIEPTSDKRTKSDTINISEPSRFTFRLKPWEELSQWLYLSPGYTYHLSSGRKGDVFFMKLKDNGQVVKIDKDGMKLPDRPGSFKLMAGDNEMSIILVISSH